MKSVGFSRIDVLMLNLPFLWIVRSDLKIQDFFFWPGTEQGATVIVILGDRERRGGGGGGISITS
jgi:hypothetical protein